MSCADPHRVPGSCFVSSLRQLWLRVQDLREPFSPFSLIVRVMCSVLGLFVQQSGPRLRDAAVQVYIANHVTHFDHNVINLLTSCNTVSGALLGAAGLWGLSKHTDGYCRVQMLL